LAGKIAELGVDVYATVSFDTGTNANK